MKIVHIITRLIVGGAQENTLITCELLANRGHDVTLITGPALGPEGDLFDWTAGQKYKTILVRPMIRPIHPAKDILAYRQIKKLLIYLQPDIVHTHSAKAGILGRFAGYSLKEKNKHQNRPLIVHTIHGLAFHNYQNPLLNRFYIAIERTAAKRTDAFISVADTMTSKMLAAGIGRPEMFTTAYSAVKQQDYLKEPDKRAIKDFRRKYGISEEAVVIVSIARLAELKGHEYIIESAHRLAPKFPNLVWLMVGDGSLADRIKSQVQLANLGYRFKFTGLLDPAEIPLALHSSDILVHCSLREGLARALPQAMLAGKPVVCFDIDGAAEVVNEKTGFLIPPLDINALTAACEKLVENPQLRRQLGSSGRAFVREKFSPETMVDTIENVYKNLLERSTIN